MGREHSEAPWSGLSRRMKCHRVKDQVAVKDEEEEEILPAAAGEEIMAVDSGPEVLVSALTVVARRRIHGE